MAFYTLVVVLILIACILMVLIVLIQNPKGGGLASGFSASNQVMGVRKTTDFLEKGTWTLAISLLALSLLASMVLPRQQQDTGRESLIKEQVNNAVDPTQIPNLPNQKVQEQTKETQKNEKK